VADASSAAGGNVETPITSAVVGSGDGMPAWMGQPAGSRARGSQVWIAPATTSSGALRRQRSTATDV
jgi:hypothetical protein